MRLPWRRPSRHRLVRRRVVLAEAGDWLLTYVCERCEQRFPVARVSALHVSLSLWEPCPGAPREVQPSVAQADEVVPHDVP